MANQAPTATAELHEAAPVVEGVVGPTYTIKFDQLGDDGMFVKEQTVPGLATLEGARKAYYDMREALEKMNYRTAHDRIIGPNGEVYATSTEAKQKPAPIGELGISPPPWSCDDNHEEYEGIVGVFDHDGRFIVGTGDMEDCEWREIADARLMAAAPDLYECLRQMATGDIDSLTAWQERADAALRKAKEG